MKKIRVILIVVGLVVSLGSCNLLGFGEKTYSYSDTYSTGSDEYGFVVEVTTGDSDLQDVLETEGYEEGPGDITDPDVVYLDKETYNTYDATIRYLYEGVDADVIETLDEFYVDTMGYEKE